MPASNKVGLAAAVLVLLAGPASASIVEADYSGLVSAGSDGTGLFGLAPGSDLAGYQFTVAFRYDTAGAHYSSPTPDDPTYSGTLRDLLSATLTINGVEKSFTPPDPASAFVSMDNSIIFGSGPGGSYETQAIFGLNDNTLLAEHHIESLLHIGGFPSIPVGLTFEDTPDWAGTLFGSFHYSSFDGESTHPPGISNELEAHGILAPTVGTVRVVPEPDVWALMLLGFSGVGSILRRRRGAEARCS